MARIIILTASTGGGHDKAADNLRILLTESGHIVQVSQFMREINRPLNYVVVNSYKQMSLRSPSTFGRLYNLSNRRLVNKRFSNVLNIVGKSKLLAHIEVYKPDLIIGTHLLASNIICTLKAQNKIRVPYLSVVTDFFPHLSYINPFVNAYIVGAELTRNVLIQNGIKSRIIYNYGMPLTPNFYAIKPQPIEPFTLLIMSGSIGLNFIDDILDYLSKSYLPLKCIVVCGNNKHLLKNLEKQYADDIKSGHFELYGFVDKVDLLMDRAHVIVTKPGGLTTSEAIAKELPLLIPFAMPGQEEENTEFLLSAGAALRIRNGENLMFILNQIHEDDRFFKLLKQNVTALKRTYDINATLRLIDAMSLGEYGNF
ncbi:hypothetical protein KHM83_07025 [Fusibacter paucivorans]|uniref:Processive 1,2-diacylglycerol beta-glucosyltransferase n=1 Tax=Fusibacter paucivorans TaxID=76009 RepID=A0ABS5PML0_9FIRM|nr:glycosyltransferase [Fusibacter paucivorans]MBS7526425.1 hypothetical protein [Fusibacter paucivorans]